MRGDSAPESVTLPVMKIMNIIFHSWVSNPKNYIFHKALALQPCVKSYTEQKNVTEITMNRNLLFSSLTVLIGYGKCDQHEEVSGLYILTFLKIFQFNPCAVSSKSTVRGLSMRYRRPTMIYKEKRVCDIA